MINNKITTYEQKVLIFGVFSWLVLICFFYIQIK